MNRLTNAFASATGIPHPPEVLPSSSSTPPQSTRRDSSRHSRVELNYAQIYDDPRRTIFYAAETSQSSASSFNGNSRSSSLPRSIGRRERHPTIWEADRSPRLKVRYTFGGSKGEGKRGWGVSTIPGSSRINCMAKGPNGRYAIGGGQYLRIIQVKSSKDHSPERMDEVVNLWKPSYLVDKSISDLDWGAHDLSSKIFSAAPSGNFLIFDVNKGKLDREVRGGHSRPINVIRVCQSQSHSGIIITGGTEGQARIFDIRQREPNTKKHYKHSGAITSLTFAPESPHQFLVGLDNGSIQRYDLRNQYKATGRIWGAHGNKAVMDLKWKDGTSGWLASAGEDRTVQIWDMSQSWERPPTPTHTLHIAQPVRRIVWRPNHPTDLVVIPNASPLSAIDPTIASIPQGLESYQTIENNIEIWDVRRHYVPKYAVPIVSDGTPIDLDWWDDDRLVGAFPGSFTEIDIRERLLPLENLPRQIMAWSPRGELVYALDKFQLGEIPFDDPQPELANHWDRIGKRPKAIQDTAYEPVQALGTLALADVDEEDFEFLAQNYRLEGGSAVNICLWNRSVAEHCGRHDDARLWSFLQVLIDEFTPHSPTVDPFSAPAMPKSDLPSPSLSPRQTAVSARRSPSPIALERIDDTLDDIEELLTISSSSSSIANQAIQPSRGIHPRVFTFAPFPSTLSRTDSEKPSPQPRPIVPSLPSTFTSPPISSGRGTPRPLLAQIADRTGRRMSAQVTAQLDDGNDDEDDDDDYPDPYGVMPSAVVPIPIRSNSVAQSYGRGSASSGSTARASNAHQTRPPRGSNDFLDTSNSQRNLSTTMTSTTDISRPIPTTRSPRSSHKPSPQAAAVPPPRVDSPIKRVQLPPASLDPNGMISPWGKVDRSSEFGQEEWTAYKKQRMAPLLAWWLAYVDDGEVQLASTLLVVGREYVDFPVAQSERIVHAYLELLEAHHLAVQAAYVKKYAGLDSMETRAGDDGVTHVVHCASCGRSTGSVEISHEEASFWWCKRCKKNARYCVVCHRPVKGLYLGCRQCHHGGHQKCMRLHYLESEPREYMSVARAGQTDKSRTSGETYRSSGDDLKHMSDTTPPTAIKTWNPCATGCGCKCRITVGFAEEL
ncbi:WD40-repeat-containing domain protein [Kockovaella imperatae]|uniref:WD40-repeat-containing domain protein n=1 Tax=Kockovaella imperatae TaxID=4999 RepID=A0A1Y1UJH1_9TREE|nr:WD40-repeat-containing domain protein [Kockovaella imperatae]ORX37616.1 WD40-repeat-containing domain protein [Kockovaella imperatae]